MSYTDDVRIYCKENKGQLLDVSKAEKIFQNIPHKTLLKILNRLDEEGLVSNVSKGIYKIANVVINEKLILEEYVDDGKGMVVGYQLFNSLGISDYQDGEIVIYTNVINTMQKTIHGYKLKKYNIVFDDDIIDLIALLELLEGGYTIKGIYFDKYIQVIELLLPEYSDELFERIVCGKNYKFSTIKTLSNWLRSSNVENKCLDIYAKCNK